MKSLCSAFAGIHVLALNMASQGTPEPSWEQPCTESERARLVGAWLAGPPPGEEVVITGIAGRFPESDDIYQYRENLYNKVEMMSADDRRWDPSQFDLLPKHTGKMNLLEKFDAGFFGVHSHQAHSMDPVCRQLLERAVEAVLDAGLHPDELRGSRTGVFVTGCISESQKTWFFEKLKSPNCGITGCTRSVQAQWISYYFGLEGTSFSNDTACSSSLYALEHAYRAIRRGKCDRAIVAAGSLVLNPYSSLQFARLGMLSKDGCCKSFDAGANGYARSESVSVLFLQRAKDARRIYAQIVHGKSNCDGFKEQGITYPSGLAQKQLLDEIYLESNVDPATVDYIEAHATGTKVGESQELAAIDAVFCSKRKKPAYVGSVKSNHGHTESASGLCSIIKVLLAMENNHLIPNLRYKQPGVEALIEGRMVVVTEKIPWPANGSGLATVSNFGFGGANSHVLLKRFQKKKVNEGQPKDDLPRLICVSGRTEDAITYFLDDLRGRSLDAEFARLLHEVFKENIEGHQYRGYTVMSKKGELTRDCSWHDGEKRPLCLIFSGPSEKLLRSGNTLIGIPLFATSIQNIHDILLPKGINLKDIIIKQSPKNLTSVIIGSVAVQIALTDVLKTIGLLTDYLIGYSVGELACAYADGALTAEQTIMSAYYISQGLKEANNGVIKNYQSELEKHRVQGIIPAGMDNDDNIDKNHTLSGTCEMVTQFINSLKGEGVILKDVGKKRESDSKQLTKMRTKLLQQLKNVIPNPKQRSPKWITTSVSKNHLTSEAANAASAEYFVNNLLRPVLLTEAKTLLPPTSVKVEIDSDMGSLHSFTSVKLMGATKNHTEFLCGLGRLYESGYNPKLEKLYPAVQWPVSVDTPMISPLIKWNHVDDWFVALYKLQENLNSRMRTITFNVKDNAWSFMTGHVIDGRNLFPAMGYLYLVWETLAQAYRLSMSSMQIIFENVKFHEAVNITKNDVFKLFVMVEKMTGRFEVANLGQPVVTGKIYAPKDFSQEVVDIAVPAGVTDHISLTTKDIYKELKLRGYDYNGAFRGLQTCDVSRTSGTTEWTGNWITFMDQLLQIKILHHDTRTLLLPTFIERLAIDSKGHIEHAATLGENPSLPIFVCKESGIIKSGAVEMRGLLMHPIPRYKPLERPVLEAHKFVPFKAKLPLAYAVRVNIQLLLENTHEMRPQIVEVADTTGQHAPLLGPIIQQILVDQPLVQPEIVVLSKEHLNLANVAVRDRKLAASVNVYSLVVASNVLRRPEIIQQALVAMKRTGFILSREALSFSLANAERQVSKLGLDILTVYETGAEKLVLLRKSIDFRTPTAIDLSNSFENLDWLPTLQTAINKEEKVLVYAQVEFPNGILGFVNCLRREPDSSNATCVVIMNEAPKFDINNEFYHKQLKKGLAINVFQGGQWGTYRHMSLEKAALVQTEHIFKYVMVKGDLSSLRWIEGPLNRTSELPPYEVLVHIYYTGLNFRDIVSASGRISKDLVKKKRMQQHILQGYEFAGRDRDGRRVMGMQRTGALASMVAANSHLVHDIPDDWTMEDAATVPVAYSIALRSLLVVGRIKPGQSILIHSGTGGVGQAAINVALHFNCEVYTTVGSQEKRDFIRKHFPQIPDSHIEDSHDICFEQMIHSETKGRGVDIVLNSLAEEKLQASLRCLAPGGKFLQIGRCDIEDNNLLDIQLLTQGRSCHSIMLDAFFDAHSTSQNSFRNLITEGLKMGCIKPLPRTIFKDDEVELAFGHIADSKPGKVIIELRHEERQTTVIPKLKLFTGIPRFYCDSKCSFIICGGMGGFGLELADWLVLRGARKLVLVSRKGLTTGYQASRLWAWKTYGATTVISKADITTQEGCVAVINEANAMGPVQAIFNLALVLRDALLENQTKEKFSESLAPKVTVTKLLDSVSRQMCPELKHFVVFSSISCGRGIVGQTNYGMANSITERICEQRKQDGYPGLAIQWGAVGDVGFVAEMQELEKDIETAGTLQQRITSCLEVLDTFLRQEEPVVSSMVVAEKKGGMGGANNIVDAVRTILGIRDLKAVGLFATLPQLGMDSIMAVEIKQTMERDYDTFLSAQEIRGMTFARLQEIAQEQEAKNQIQAGNDDEKEATAGQSVLPLLPIVNNDETAKIPIVRLTSLIAEKAIAPKIFLLPEFDGTTNVLEPLTCNLTSHVLCLQFPSSEKPEVTVEDMAKSLVQHIQDKLTDAVPFTLVAHSYSCVIAMELASILEKEGHTGTVVLIDGSPAMCKELLQQEIPDAEFEPILQTLVLCALMKSYMSLEDVLKYENEILNCTTFEERVNLVLGYLPKSSPSAENQQRRVCTASYMRIRSVLTYKPNFRKLRSTVKLFKPTQATVDGFPHDYRLQQICEYPVEVSSFEGNHLTILNNIQMAQAINSISDASSEEVKQAIIEDNVQENCTQKTELRRI